MLPIISPEEAERHGGATRRSHRRTVPPSYADKSIALTVSVGLTDRDTRSDRSIEQIIARADDALYRAQGSGRNRVIKDYLAGRLSRRDTEGRAVASLVTEPVWDQALTKSHSHVSSSNGMDMFGHSAGERALSSKPRSTRGIQPGLSGAASGARGRVPRSNCGRRPRMGRWRAPRRLRSRCVKPPRN